MSQPQELYFLRPAYRLSVLCRECRLQFFVAPEETTRDTDRALYYCGSGSNSYDGLGAPLRRIPGPYHASRSMDCHLADAASCVQGLMAPGQPNRLFISAWSFRGQLYRAEDVAQDRYVFRVNPCPLIPHAVWIYLLRHIIKPNLAYDRSERGSRRGNQACLTRCQTHTRQTIRQRKVVKYSCVRTGAQMRRSQFSSGMRKTSPFY